MQLRPAVLAALVAAAHALPQYDIPDVDYEDLACIGECFLNDATSGWVSSKCKDRDPMDDNYSDCVCDSIKADPFYDCALKCPKDQRDEYEKAMKGLCPNLFSGGSGGDDKDDSKDDDKDDDNEKADKGDDDDDDDSNDKASSTNDSSNDDEDEDEDDAAIRNGPALLAAVAAVAAFVL